MPLAKREWSPLFMRHGLAAVGLGLLLGFLGPFGSYPAYDRIDRYAFWVGLTLIGYLFGLAAWRLLAATPQLAKVGGPLRATCAGLLSAIPQMFVVGWAMSQLQPGRIISLLGLPMLFLAVAAVQLILLTAIAMIDRPANSRPVEAGSAPAEAPNQPVAGRIIADRSKLIALEAQDHYVRVHSIAGATLVLHRLSDAIAEVGSIDGLQVHRGWWVASRSVTGIYIEGGRRWLKLANGLKVPVSRARTRAVISRGWPRL